MIDAKIRLLVPLVDELQEVADWEGVRHILGLQPRPPSHRDSELDIFELSRRVRVGVHDELHSLLHRPPRPEIVEVKPIGRPVYLEHLPVVLRGLDHPGEVKGVPLPPSYDPVRWMKKYVDGGVLQSPHRPLCELLGGLPERLMYRGANDVESVEEAPLEVEAPVRPHLCFDRLQYPEGFQLL